MQVFSILGKRANQFLNDESGATAIEYALIAGIMGAGIVAGFRTVQTATDTSLEASGTAVADAF